MNSPLDWPTYLRSIAGDVPAARIAERIDVSASTVSRWFSGATDPRPRDIIKVARAYGVTPLTALIGAGYLDEGDIKLDASVPRRLQLRDFTDLELAEEMLRRVAAGPSPILEEPLDADHPAMQPRVEGSE